ncbi:hypothetical protein [Streptomyces mirabilis]
MVFALHVRAAREDVPRLIAVPHVLVVIAQVGVTAIDAEVPVDRA